MNVTRQNCTNKQLCDKKTEGAILRSKAWWHELGERNTKYVLNLHRKTKSFQEFTVARPIPHNNKLSYDQSEILQEQKIFFEALYKSHSTIQHKFG